MRLRRGDRLVVASHNPGKVREIGALLAPFAVAAVGAAELGLAEPEETETTFAGNARLKAEAASIASQIPALADDSGLCVSALGGAPGIYSARWAAASSSEAIGKKKERDFAAAMARVERELAGNPDRHAMFACALALAAPGADTEIFEGRVFGNLTFPPRGIKGFGYDPIFVPENGRFTFGEMDPDAKHAISHRARAFEKFAAAVLK